MGGKTVRERLKGRELQLFGFFSMLLLFIAGAAGAIWEGEGVWDIVRGLWTIVVSRDALITDYFELAGYGAAFLNAVLVMAMGLTMLLIEKIPFTGLTLAAIFINAGYALWGKNPVNILPILFGFFLYAKLHRTRMSRYIYTAFFGTSLAPLVTELIFLLPFGRNINMLIAVSAGILTGFVLPGLSVHTASMHMGYNLYNVGFSAGILAFVMVCVLKSFGIEGEAVMLWRSGRPLGIVLGLYGYFFLTYLYGLYLNRWDPRGILKIWRHPGRAVADFVLMEDVGSTLMNMAVTGAASAAYICLIGGDFSGPVVGAVLTAFGFSAFGAHLKNYVPVLVGVYLYAFLSRYTPTTPGVQLAAVFAVGLSPISGRFGVTMGMIAGMLHVAIVMCTSQMYGGLNLYNNGFSAGWVAIVMVPVLESFMMEFKGGNWKK